MNNDQAPRKNISTRIGFRLNPALLKLSSLWAVWPDDVVAAEPRLPDRRTPNSAGAHPTTFATADERDGDTDEDPDPRGVGFLRILSSVMGRSKDG